MQDNAGYVDWGLRIEARRRERMVRKEEVVASVGASGETNHEGL
jgi:hypothetical protein